MQRSITTTELKTLTGQRVPLILCDVRCVEARVKYPATDGEIKVAAGG